MTEILVKPFVCLTFALLFIAGSSGAAYASEAGEIDEGKEASLTVVLEAGGEAAAGIEINIYQAAELIFEDGSFSYESLYEGYSFEGMNASENAAAAAELSETVQEVYACAAADSEGKAYFADLPFGVYLVELSEEYADEEKEYYFDPYLVFVPLSEEEDGEIFWTYAVVSTPKAGDAVSASLAPAVGEKIPYGLYYSAFFLSLAGILALSLWLFKNRNCLVKGKNNGN